MSVHVSSCSGKITLVTALSARRADLASEMHALVWEQASLHEVTNQVRDWRGDGRVVVHGPWTAAECQSVLIPWHAAGWIELITRADWPTSPSYDWQDRASRAGEFLVLSEQDATDLLQDSARWMVGTADGQVMLCRTDDGHSHEYVEWLELANKRED